MSGIAVIVPCRNLGRTVREALASVDHQTRPPAEVIVVDDGSVDLFTRQELSSLAREGVSIIRTESVGLAAARNTGIRATTASYICALDADDILEPTYLEATAAMLDEQEGLAFVGSAVRSFGEPDSIWTPPPCDLESAFSEGVAPQSSLFRRELWDALGGYDEALSVNEDFDFWVKAMESGFRGTTLSEPLLRRRVRRDSMHRAVQNGTHVDGMVPLHGKHRHIIERLGPSLMARKEAFLESQRAHLATLKERLTAISSDLQQLDTEIGQLRTTLSERGAPHLDWGELRRTRPFSDIWGLDRGKPLDRYYIERFLDTHRSDIRGRVLEIKDDGYTRMFGGAGIEHVDVLDLDGTNEKATIVADLSVPHAIGSASFDCFILTQTLHIIENFRPALAECGRLLAPGGVLLCTVPAVSRISYEDGGRDGDYWRFTEAAIRVLFAETFGIDRFTISGYGNVLACTGFLYGLAPDELTAAELDDYDPWFPLIFGVRAQKAIA